MIAPKKMTRAAAQIMAVRQWGSSGRAWLRCSAVAPCEVGVKSQSGPRKGWADTVFGRGRTWAEAFADAEDPTHPPRRS